VRGEDGRGTLHSPLLAPLLEGSLAAPAAWQAQQEVQPSGIVAWQQKQYTSLQKCWVKCRAAELPAACTVPLWHSWSAGWPPWLNQGPSFGRQSQICGHDTQVRCPLTTPETAAVSVMISYLEIIIFVQQQERDRYPAVCSLWRWLSPLPAVKGFQWLQPPTLHTEAQELSAGGTQDVISLRGRRTSRTHQMSDDDCPAKPCFEVGFILEPGLSLCTRGTVGFNVRVCMMCAAKTRSRWPWVITVAATAADDV